jgi:hypothetical protein
MKKIYLMLTMMSTLRNQYGSYAYRVDAAFADTDGKDPLDIDDLGIQNIREYDEEFTLFDRAKLCAPGKQVKAVGVVRLRNGVSYLNLEDKNALRKATELDSKRDDIEDSVALIAHAEKAARRLKMSDRGLDVVVNNLSTSMFAGINTGATARVRKVEQLDETPVKKQLEQPKDEQPQDSKDANALKIEALKAKLEELIAAGADQDEIDAVEAELAQVV